MKAATNNVYKPLLAAVCERSITMLPCGNSTTKRIGNLPAIAQPKPGRQAQRLIHVDVSNNKMTET